MGTPVNPYLPPSTPPDGEATEERRSDTIADVTRGHRCEECGGTNTSSEKALRAKPSILAVLFFGWVFLLIRAAFSRQRENCHDCGATRLYKTAGSKLAMVFLLLLAILAAIGYFAPPP